MIVSRDYIPFDKLIPFPVQDRFLKLPIEKFLELEGIEPIGPQIAMINAIQDPKHRQICGCLSRRTGKTFIANTLGFLKTMEPGTKVLIVSPNYSLSGISWNEQVRLLNNHGIEITSKNKTEKEIHLENGSMIKFGSVNNADSLVGRSYDLIIFDECALDPRGGDAFNIQLRPTLDKDNSKVVFISTPRGTNWFYDFYMRGFSDKFPSWVSIHSTWEDNPRASPSDIEEAKRGMSRAEFQQEYMADFTTFEGMIYEGFNWDKCVRDLSSHVFSDEAEVIMGIDPGYKDPTGGVLVYVEPSTGEVFVVWDYNEAGRTTSAHADVFRPIIDKHGVELLFVDSAAAQFRMDLATDHDIASSLAKKSVLDGISFVQSLVDNDKLIVDEKCKHILFMLNNYRWDPNENLLKAKPLHDASSHVADALRYALYTGIRYR